MIKIRGDSCWRDLTAMCYHYETQVFAVCVFDHKCIPLCRMYGVGTKWSQSHLELAPKCCKGPRARRVLATQTQQTDPGTLATGVGRLH
jgi:hypothetical protein